MNDETTYLAEPDEELALRKAARRWMAGIPVTPLPTRRRHAVRRSVAAAGSALLLAAGLLLLIHSDPAPAPAAPAVLRVGPTAPPGSYPPPDLGQVLILTDRAAEVRVDRVSPGSIEATRVAVIYGDAEGLPDRFTLSIPSAVSEIGREEVKAEKGEHLLLLLSMKEGVPRLATGNAWSVVSARGTCFLWTADLHRSSYQERRTMVKAALDLMGSLRETAWSDQGPLLAAAVASEDPLRREFALDWYRMYRMGYASKETSVVPEVEERRPALREVDDALLPLVLPQKGALSTLSGIVLELLLLEPPERWVPELDRPARAEAAMVLLREMERTEALRSSLKNALAATAEHAGPVARYLATALRHRELAAAAEALPETERDRLAGWKHVPAWPPDRLAAWLARQR